uniref:Uncharacterized protein n=1 Tax=Anguilla anguilla TaxID=7936 RepID=A0A0E9U5Z4_ANGAN
MSSFERCICMYVYMQVPSEV